jgi:hypothetical protein
MPNNSHITLRWINSGGGPLLLLEKSLLPYWGGAYTSNGDTDYDRACAIEGYIGLIEVGDGNAIVLGDEPLQTSLLRLPNEEGLMVIRWEFAPDEFAVLNALGHEGVRQQADISVSFKGGPLVLFDSAYSGLEIEDSLETTLRPGSYQLDTMRLQPNKQTSLILHRIRPFLL